MNEQLARGTIAIILATSVAVLSGCAAMKGSAVDTPRGTSPLMDMNLAAWNKRDPAAIAALYHPEGVYAVPGAPPMKGPTAVAQYSGTIFTAVPDFKVTPVSVDVVNDRLTVTRWVMTGTWRRPFPSGAFAGATPTGKTFTVPGATFYETEGGKIKKSENFFDQMVLATQLGLLPPPGGGAPK